MKNRNWENNVTKNSVAFDKLKYAISKSNEKREKRADKLQSEI